MDRYLVRLNEINLSESAFGDVDHDEKEYYVVLHPGGDALEFRSEEERFRLYPNNPYKAEILTVILNTDELIKVQAFRKRGLLKSDKSVLFFRVHSFDCSSWVFQSKISPADGEDRTSYVVFETFGPLN